jgi:hypothetical protein
MFDVRPVDKTGDLDWKKIQSIGNSRDEIDEFEKNMMIAAQLEREELQRIEEENRLQQERQQKYLENEKIEKERQKAEFIARQLEAEAEAEARHALMLEKIAETSKNKRSKKRWFGGRNIFVDFSWHEIFSPPTFVFQLDAGNSLKVFTITALVVLLGVGTVTYASRGFGLKARVLGSSADGLANLSSAVSDIAHQNFEGSTQQFNDAYANFSQGSSELESMGGLLIDATRFVPFATKISSGKNAVEAGKHFAVAGKSLNEVAKVAANLKNPIDDGSQSSTSLLDVFQSAQKNITSAKTELDAAQKNIDAIAIDDLPIDKRDKFLLLKQKLPDLRAALDFFLNNSQVFADLLGGNGPRKYLFLFQNNSEMRATGGFIGTYGLLDIANGHVKKFFIDGIFNPDGQLKDRIVPPAPIQKISANWSMHDSNWFADFPLSAKKAIQFYEKTGGPTADGVITITPTVMQKLLAITGPIEMPEYGVTLDKDNFIELTQNEVEVDYDKQDNKPKKILSDLAPLVLEKLLSSKDLDIISKTAEALLDGLREKHILLYSENSQLEKLISDQGWSGEVIQTPKDYLSVINTNVNGFKTDAVVDEHIDHQAQIQEDGSIIDTVTITRKHNGGNSAYEWFNKVNADYMRVYVPSGSKLLEVNGQTREVDKPPLDYDALGFKRDDDVVNLEKSMTVDQSSGTQIFQESNKTVFANWVYVSPQESVTVTYKYLLPFALFQVAVENQQQVDSYSLALQKQSGSVGSSFVSHISFPAKYDVKWNFPAEIKKDNNGLGIDSVLKTDLYEGVVFEKK